MVVHHRKVLAKQLVKQLLSFVKQQSVGVVGFLVLEEDVWEMHLPVLVADAVQELVLILVQVAVSDEEEAAFQIQVAVDLVEALMVQVEILAVEVLVDLNHLHLFLVVGVVLHLR
jgi:hypothetical protein